MTTRNLFRYDPDVGFTFIPNITVRVPHETGGYLVRTNALGFRSDRLPTADAGSARRIFVFGDSFTAGDGVSNGMRFSDQLEKLIPNSEVHNFGLSGSGTDQQFIIFQKFARSLPCHLVIVAVLVENIRRITSQFRPAHTQDGRLLFHAKPYFELDGGNLKRFHSPVPEVPVSADDLAAGKPDATVDTGGRYPALRRLVRSLGMKEALQRLTGYQPVPDFDSKTSPAWLLMRAILTAWRDASKAPIMVVPLPLYQHVEETADATAYRKRFSELASECHIPVHDVLPDLQRYELAERRRFRFPTDVHLTPLGHRAIAESLAPAVKAILSEIEQGSLSKDRL